jgi:hypothetical protein
MELRVCEDSVVFPGCHSVIGRIGVRRSNGNKWGMRVVSPSSASKSRTPEVSRDLLGEAGVTYVVLSGEFSALRVAPPAWHRAWEIPGMRTRNQTGTRPGPAPVVAVGVSGLLSPANQNNDYEPPSAMISQCGLRWRVLPAGPVGLAASGSIPKGGPSVCQFSGHIWAGLPQESARFARIRGFTSQACNGPMAAYAWHSRLRVKASAMNCPVGLLVAPE